MEPSVRLRLGLAAPLLAALYYYLLVFIIGWTSTRFWPTWWFGVFPTRHMAAVTWMVGLHTLAVFSAALPVAVIVVFTTREKVGLLSALVGILATALAVFPSMSPDIWPLIWNNHPIIFVTDHIKILVAVPFTAWIIGKILSKPWNANDRLTVDS